MKEINIVVHQLSQLEELARQLLDFSENCCKFAFYGEIGAGKTTLVKSIGKILSVEDEITSPTFSIVNEYDIPNGLLRHLDLYRLKNTQEALDINIEEYLYDSFYTIIEWPEIIEPLFPDKMVYLRIEINEDSSRNFNIKKSF